MTRMLDCLLSYFGLDEHDRPGFRRYFCYHILAGPGPTEDAGVAVIRILALHREAERCDSCQLVHAVESGGPEAAISTAIHYLDAYHERDHVRKVQSDLRLSDGEPNGNEEYSMAPATSRVAQGSEESTTGRLRRLPPFA